ncbi:MAG: hypothetical protein Q8P69_02040 [bacterium]|nr:hypothetical protein [bacterium]
MAKFKTKITARQLRTHGASIKDIAKKLDVSPSTVSIWCRDITLSPTQIKQLLKSKEKNITAGRLRGAQIQRERKLTRIEMAKQEALKLKSLTENEFWIAGLALYLAEGSKRMGRVQFTNSDPRIIKFMLRWFKKFYNISKQDIKCSIIINQIHQTRDSIIKEYWQKYLTIQPERFTDVRYVKTKQSKVYQNHDNYFGTFSFRINKSTQLLNILNALTDRLLNL